MSEQNKALVRRYLEVFSSHDISVVDECTTEDIVYHGPGREVYGREGVKDLIGMYMTAFPDARLVIEDQIAEGDKVVTRARAVGTNSGPMGPMPASGKSVDLMLIVIHRFEGGRLAEEWELFEELQMMQALGAIPGMG